MEITFWILFIFFGALTTFITLRLLTTWRLNFLTTIIWIIGVIVISLGCGMIWGNVDEKIFGENIVGKPSTIIEQIYEEVQDGLGQVETRIKQ